MNERVHTIHLIRDTLRYGHGGDSSRLSTGYHPAFKIRQIIVTHELRNSAQEMSQIPSSNTASLRTVLFFLNLSDLP